VQDLKEIKRGNPPILPQGGKSGCGEGKKPGTEKKGRKRIETRDAKRLPSYHLKFPEG